jgi:hypothetical protein
MDEDMSVFDELFPIGVNNPAIKGDENCLLP